MTPGAPETGVEGLKSDFFLYQYEPSVAAAALFIALFAITTGLHSYQMIRTRTWFFIPFVCGGLCETIGFAGRTYSASESPFFTLGPYIVQAVLLLVAPALFAASTYMELGKLSDLVGGEKYLLLPRRWVTRTFVTGDVICFLLQAGGAGLMANKTLKTRDSGAHIVVGGLFVQIVFFGGFVVSSLVFHSRVRKTPTPRSQTMPYQRHLVALYLSSILIFSRSIVRAVEFIQGFFGYIISHEAFLYGFDSVLMLLVMVVFNWVHPSEIQSLLGGGDALRGLKLVRSRGEPGLAEEPVIPPAVEETKECV
ncbi:RTA1 domain protein [Apodospora peruviana]|uniref:RTA1 domain protein n=1 Tax=Apodospora peruviana TaxID=516989 RepID=A0AAE0MFP4_9PEZI|nr:RTA1 domain protein [Apodospora peruviana]